MRKGFLGSLAVLAAGSGLTFAQPYTPPPPRSAGPMNGPAVRPSYGSAFAQGPGALPPPGPMPGPMGMPGMEGMPPGVGGNPPGVYAPGPYPPGPYGPAMMGPGGPMDGMGPDDGMGGMGAAMGAGMGAAMGGPEDGAGPGGARGVLPSLFGRGYGSRRFWAGADYLYWIPRSMPIQYPLVTTSAAANNVQLTNGDFGALGGATTAAVVGPDRDFSYDHRNGVRGVIGGTFDEAGTWGAELGGFVVESFSRNFNFGSNEAGFPLLAVPFYNTNTESQGSYIVSFPFIDTGSIRIDVDTRVWGVEGNGVYNVSASPNGPGGLTLLAGLRFLELREQFNMSTVSTTFLASPTAGIGGSFFPAGGGNFAGAFTGVGPYTVGTTDRIRTTNDFYAAQVGFRGDIGFGDAVISITGKFAPGYMRSYIDLQGSSTLQAGGVYSTAAGGVYNLAQDLGRHRRDQFAMLGEGGVNLGYNLLPWFRLQAGYTFMYVNKVLRPTNSLAPGLNPNLIPTSPTYTGIQQGPVDIRDLTAESEFYLHGFNVGLQLTF